jgi:hypothetical protein
MEGDHQGRTPDMRKSTIPTQALPSHVSTLSDSGTREAISAGEIRQWRNSSSRQR